ncbi:Methylmalonic aciduria and homocystinuria type D mitochondrial [Micractinium conductrix]|uniref:Methylmalonic aciduria and homocystinuria type D mitochondrial n=1 Tax=Micractinium conductrix TaxID=554055 RepID=A0A2P6VLT9_9CHLO|nr:Methylmalonic aciduria and homocystinuria type D mitochondrial [Micractinium conductrix]|eukprot:PSC75053.1 Methylmalonic aciduria and homocystinuria type D mitochondrial [Micractinium conductrix]
MLVIPTCQHAQVDLVQMGEKVETEKDRLLERFVEFAKVVCERLAAAGHWADYIDPCSGLPMINRATNAVYGEVEALVTLLGYKTQNAGCCKIILHPCWGSSVYPASLFAKAPVAAAQGQAAEEGMVGRRLLQAAMGLAEVPVELPGAVLPAPSVEAAVIGGRKLLQDALELSPGEDLMASPPGAEVEQLFLPEGGEGGRKLLQEGTIPFGAAMAIPATLLPAPSVEGVESVESEGGRKLLQATQPGRKLLQPAEPDTRQELLPEEQAEGERALLPEEVTAPAPEVLPAGGRKLLQALNPEVVAVIGAPTAEVLTGGVEAVTGGAGKRKLLQDVLGVGEMPEEMPAAVLAAPATETAGVGGRKLLQAATEGGEPLASPSPQMAEGGAPLGQGGESMGLGLPTQAAGPATETQAGRKLLQALEAAPASALLVAPAVETALTPREAALLAPVVEAIAAAVPAAETTARTGGLRKLQQAGAARGVETSIYVAPAAETAISPREAALLAPVAEAIAAAAPAAEAGAARRATAALAPVPEIVAPVPATEVAQTGIAAGLAAGALFAPAAEPAAAAGGAFAPVPEIVAAVPAPEVAQTGIQAGFAAGQGQGGSRKLQQAGVTTPASALLVAPAVETALTPREAALLAPLVEAIAAAVPAAETTVRTAGLP